MPASPQRPHRGGNRSTTALVALTALVLLVTGWFALGRGSSHAPTTTTTTTTPTTVAPPTTTTTVDVDVGTLPQTHALPSVTSPTLALRLQAFLNSIASGRLKPGLTAFFPLTAYLQTKSGGGNDYDWHYRLVTHYANDLATLHRSLDPSGRHLTFVSASTPLGAVWITPGIEENKGSYYRTLNATVSYRFGTTGAIHTTRVLCMISWRGQWYIVHILSFA